MNNDILKDRKEAQSYELEKERKRNKTLKSLSGKLKVRFGERFNDQIDKEGAEYHKGLIEEDLTPEVLIEIAQLLEVINNTMGWAHADKESALIDLEEILDSSVDWVDRETLQFAFKQYGEMIDLVPNAHSGLWITNPEDGSSGQMAYVAIPEGSRWSVLNRDNSKLLKALKTIIDSGLPLHPSFIDDIRRLEAEA